MRRLLSFLLMMSVASTALSQVSSALINEALDKITPLNLNGTLPQVMSAIGRETGVRIDAAPMVWELLPWGDQTNVTAKIENQTLRESLTAITRKLGLTWTLKDESVELQPMPPLARLGRRSTVQELQALDLLASNPLQLTTDRPTVRQLIEAVDARLLAIDEQFKKANQPPPALAIESRTGDSVPPDRLIFVPRNASLMDALESLVKETRATWYPWGKSIVIVAKEDQVRNLLNKSLTVRFNGVDIQQVLMELSQRSGIEFAIEPGALQQIPQEFRSIRLIIENATVKQAMENISGVTGLGYVVNESGIYIWHRLSETDSRPGAMFGILQLDNGMQVFIPESSLPPDMREYLELRKQRELDKIRQMMKEEGFKPTSRPTGKEDL
jgi:hypothetical protein